jgi:methionyl-tRNA synthetase
MQAKQSQEPEPTKDAEEVEEVPEITIDDFAKVKFAVGEIIECKKHPKADRLLVSKVELGSEVRQIVSGIADSYSPDELVGKQVIVVKNLKPVKLRGELSEGMILAATKEDGKVSIVTVDQAVNNGAEVR